MSSDWQFYTGVSISVFGISALSELCPGPSGAEYVGLTCPADFGSLAHPSCKEILPEWLTGYSPSIASIQLFVFLVSLSLFAIGEGINRGSKPTFTKAVSFRVPWSRPFLSSPWLLCRGSWYISYIVCSALLQSPVMSVCTVCQAEHWRGDLESGPPHPTHPVGP